VIKSEGQNLAKLGQIENYKKKIKITAKEKTIYENSKSVKEK